MDSTPTAVATATNFKVEPCLDVQKLNGYERKFYQELRRKDHQWIGVQNLTLKLGADCRYTPDFTTLTKSGRMVAWEVKGFMREDAAVKLRVAARMFPWMRFYLVTRKSGCWNVKLIQP